MIGLIKSLLGGGTMKAIESIATEWIETSKEKAEASTILIKALDPNGLMRRQLSKRVTDLYTLYLIITLLLLICESFGWSPIVGGQSVDGVIVGGELAVSVATSKITELFLPITTLFGVIVSASFGVNYANVKNGK